MRGSRRARYKLKYLMIGLAGIFLLQIACGQNEETASTFRVALLSPGPVSDAGWNAAAYEGLLLIRDSLQAQISQIETKTPSAFEEAFRDYAQRGYDLIFGHGFEFQDAAANVSRDFPNTVFITTSGNTVRRNVAPMVFQLEQATYLAGYLAGAMTESGKIGAVGGMSIPPVERTFAAFAAGARAARPDVKISTSYIGNWEDAGAARQAALALIDQGCDFLIHNADAAAAGVFQAAGERGVFVFGTNKDQNAINPEHVLASCVSNIPQAFLEMARTVKQGKFAARIFRLGMAENVVRFVINPALQNKIPPAVHEALGRIEHRIRSGALEIPATL